MSDMPYPSWLSFLRQCWDQYNVSPHTLVDLGCGTGSLSLPLAQSGMQVTGIDISADMLAVAHNKSEELRKLSQFAKGGSIQWIEQDMREWELPNRVDCVISFCDCLNYLTEEDDVLLAIKKTFAGLTPGGLFIFDVHAPQQLVGYAESQPFIMDEPDIAYIWTCEYDEARMEIEHHLSIFDRQTMKGTELYRKIEETHIERAYPREWIEQQLTMSGFEVLSVSADFTFDPPVEQSERLFFVARRP
ncbi:MAG: class I SAM-dependent methyltransferase [Paenibacillaceae bacterium]